MLLPKRVQGLNCLVLNLLSFHSEASLAALVADRTRRESVSPATREEGVEFCITPVLGVQDKYVLETVEVERFFRNPADEPCLEERCPHVLEEPFGSSFVYLRKKIPTKIISIKTLFHFLFNLKTAYWWWTYAHQGVWNRTPNCFQFVVHRCQIAVALKIQH